MTTCCLRRWTLRAFVSVCTLVPFLSSCGGSSSSSTPAEGLELPTEVSAVAPSEAAEEIRLGRAARAAGLGAALRSIGRAIGDLEDDADYHTTPVKKFVEIEVLDIFDIIEQIFDAVRQTNHEDHVGDGWYKCLIAWEEEGDGGVTQTLMQEWYVRAFYTGSTYSMQFKVLEPDEDSGDVQLNPRTGRSHGVDDGLGGVIEINEGTRAIVFRSEVDGYGQAEFPDWDACWGPDAVDCDG